MTHTLDFVRQAARRAWTALRRRDTNPWAAQLGQGLTLDWVRMLHEWNQPADAASPAATTTPAADGAHRRSSDGRLS